MILLKFTDFGLAVRNADPDVGKVLLNEILERDDGFFFGCTERPDTFNFVLAIPNLSFESGDSSWNVHDWVSESGRVDECNRDYYANHSPTHRLLWGGGPRGDGGRVSLSVTSQLVPPEKKPKNKDMSTSLAASNCQSCRLRSNKRSNVTTASPNARPDLSTPTVRIHLSCPIPICLSRILTRSFSFRRKKVIGRPSNKFHVVDQAMATAIPATIVSR